MKRSSSNTKPFISVDDVHLRLYDRVLFKNTRWKILSDQHWAVIGANGSGKSTLMKAICGHVPVVKGKITYHFVGNGAPGSRQGAVAPPQEHIAYVSFDSQRTALAQESRFYQARWNSLGSEGTPSVSEYLAESRIKKINPYEVVEERSDPAAFMAQSRKAVELLEIEDLLPKTIIQLSNGEMRKVLIAGALIKNPRLLILDNPFTGLDKGFKPRLKRVIKRLMQDEMRIIVVTTRRDEIPPDITHVLVVKNAQVVAQGPRKAILNDISALRATNPDPLADLVELSLPQDRRPKEMKCQVLVHMEDVNISYDNAKILRHINWTVQRGENWALLGPNGSGKTTLLSLILGDNPQTYANNITLFGRRRGSGESIRDVKRHIGWVSSELHLFYPKSVSCFDVVCSGFFDSIGLYHRCSPQQRKTARQWMQRLGVLRYADVAFAGVSQGEQRMILIARALVKRPWLLVLDEPCQGLDEGNRDRVLQVIDAISAHLDANIIYVTHHSNELPRIITHVMRLNGGSIAQKARISRK